MEFSTGFKGREEEIIDLFSATFTASEGEDEGALIGELVRNLLGGTAEKDLYVFTAIESGVVIGSIVFSRLTYEQDERIVFVLAPVAVATDQQGKGITILAHRHRVYADAQRMHPNRWSRHTRNWTPIDHVWLNPPKEHAPTLAPVVAQAA
jgi:hypothetical protein